MSPCHAREVFYLDLYFIYCFYLFVRCCYVTTSSWSCSGVYKRCYYAGWYFAATTYFEGNRNPFESWPLVVVVILVVINLSYKESLWLPLGKTYVTNEIISNFGILIICQRKSKSYFSYHNVVNNLLGQQ